MPGEVPVDRPARGLGASRAGHITFALSASIAATACLAVPAAAKTGVAVDGRNITITVPIDGIGIDNRTRREWKSSAEKLWNDAFNSDDNPFKGCLKLKLVLDVEAHDYSYPAQPGRHLIFESQGSTPNQAAGTIAYNGNPYQGSADGNFDEKLGDGTRATHIAHEVGHLLGLPDEYTVVSRNPRRTRPIPGRENTLMADGGRIDAKLLKRLVDRLRNETHNVPDCRKVSGGMEWRIPIQHSNGRGVQRGRVAITLEPDENGNLTGQMAGEEFVEVASGCSMRTVTPAKHSGKVVGQYAPGGNNLSLRITDDGMQQGTFALSGPCPPGPYPWGSSWLAGEPVGQNLRNLTVSDDGRIQSTFQANYGEANAQMTLSLQREQD